MTPILSVITPVYNAEKFLSESIESILNQTFTQFEYIIIDDCSTDGSYKIAKSFQEKDPRIKLYKNEVNLNIAGNRNRGIELASGKYILWQDADDISFNNRAEKLVEFMEAHPEVGICGSYLQSFTDNKNLDVRKYAADDATLRRNIFKFSPVAQPSAIVRKSCFETLGVFNKDYPPAEDIEMSFRIGTAYKFANIPRVLLNYREHPSSATFTRMNKMLVSTQLARKRYMNDPAYSYTFSDKVAYYLTNIMCYLPPKIVVFLFKVLRYAIGVFSI